MKNKYSIIFAAMCTFCCTHTVKSFNGAYVKKILLSQYDQTEILGQQQYQEAGPDLQLKMLEENFHKKQAEAREKIRELLSSDICKINWLPIKMTAIGAPLAYAGYKLKNKLGFGALDTVGTAIGLQTLIRPIADELYELTTKGIGCLNHLTKPYLPAWIAYVLPDDQPVAKSENGNYISINNIIDAQKNLETENLGYIRIKPKLSMQLQQIIEIHFARFIVMEVLESLKKDKENGISYGTETNSKGSQKVDEEKEDKTTNIKSILDIVFNLPKKTKELAYVPSEIETAFSGYKVETIRTLQRYCIRQVAASKASTVRKVAAYFWGPPGTGKTRAAGCIAQALNLPLEVISLAEFNQKDFVGTEDDPGLLLDIITRTGRHGGESLNNMIILLDDADRVLNQETQASSFILNLLEPETKSFYSPFLKTNIDISHICFILAGNQAIKDEALRSRLQIVNFDGYNTEYKKAVAWKNMIPELIKPHEKSDLPLTMADVLQDQARIDSVIQTDNDPGFRSLKQKIMEYLEEKVLEKYFPAPKQSAPQNSSAPVMP